MEPVEKSQESFTQHSSKWLMLTHIPGKDRPMERCTSWLHPVNIHKSFYSFRFTNIRGIYLTRSCPHLHDNSYKKRQRRMCHSDFPGSRSYRVTFMRDYSRDTLWTSLGSHRHPIYFLRRYKEFLRIPSNVDIPCICKEAIQISVIFLDDSSILNSILASDSNVLDTLAQLVFNK